MTTTQLHEDGLLDVPPGLKGVVVSRTTLGDVRGDEGFYHYRQYSAVDLAVTRTFEDVWQLLVDGALPDRDAAAGFRHEVAPLRHLPPVTAGLLAEVAGTGEPLAGLRTCLSMAAAECGLRPVLDLSPGDAARRRPADGRADSHHPVRAPPARAGPGRDRRPVTTWATPPTTCGC